MPTYTALINYSHKNGHFSHILTLKASHEKRAARKAAATARRLHAMRGRFILTMWEEERFLFSRMIPACLDSENQDKEAEEGEKPCRKKISTGQAST